MTRTELSLLLLTLTPQEILEKYHSPAAEFALNLLVRSPNLNMEPVARAAYAAKEGTVARDARMAYVTERIHIHGEALKTRRVYEVLQRFEAARADARALETFPLSVAVAAADVLARVHREGMLTSLSGSWTEDVVDRHYNDTLIEIFFAWCAV